MRRFIPEVPHWVPEVPHQRGCRNIRLSADDRSAIASTDLVGFQLGLSDKCDRIQSFHENPPAHPLNISVRGTAYSVNNLPGG